MTKNLLVVLVTGAVWWPRRCSPGKVEGR